jgi:hypothetical protein
VESFDMGCSDDATWAVSANGEVSLKLYEPACDQILAWIDSSSFLSTDRRLEANRTIRLVDLYQGQVSYLFEGWYTDIAFDPYRTILLLQPRPEYPDTPELPKGFYFLSASHLSLEMLESEYRGWRWDSDFDRIISTEVGCDEGYVGALKEDGTYECIEEPLLDLLWSPSGEWGIPSVSKYQLYDKNFNLVRKIMNSQAEEFLWGPDSSSLFLIASGQLIYLELPDGDLQMIDNRNPCDIAWVGAK